jgi:alpha-N-arabinofuranosidase
LKNKILPIFLLSVLLSFQLGAQDAKIIANAYDKPYDAMIDLKGISSVEPKGKIITLSADSPEDENSPNEPMKYIPKEEVYSEFSPSFSYTSKPYSITILRIKRKLEM